MNGLGVKAAILGLCLANMQAFSNTDKPSPVFLLAIQRQFCMWLYVMGCLIIFVNLLLCRDYLDAG
jgi:hypothetical protein